MSLVLMAKAILPHTRVSGEGNDGCADSFGEGVSGSLLVFVGDADLVPPGVHATSRLETTRACQTRGDRTVLIQAAHGPGSNELPSPLVRRFPVRYRHASTRSGS